MQDKELNKKKTLEEIIKNREKARLVYDPEAGRVLLTDLLNDLDFFNMDLQTEQDMARQNSARKLLYKLGIWQPHNMRRIVDALMNMPYAREDEHSD